MSIPRQSAIWDSRRNSSQVRQPHPDALRQALQALARLDPKLRAWIQDGAPRLTEAEHLERFGEPYRGSQASRRRRQAELPDAL